MLIGHCGNNEVRYWHNLIWVRGTSRAIRCAGTLREAVEKARRQLRGFEEVA